MKRLAYIITNLAFIATLLSPVQAAFAVGTNLIANPSVEQNTNNKPTGWASDKWGTNTTAFAYKTTGHNSSHSLNVKTTAYTSGDAKWSFTPVAVSKSTSYTFNDWYQSTVASSVDVVVTTTNNKTKYLWKGDLVASSTWKQASYTFVTPATAAKMTVYHYIHGVGELTTDEFSLVNNAETAPVPTPTAPTIAISSPVANSTLSGTVPIAASATDAKGVSGVQFSVDGVNQGVEDTASPYTVNLDTTKLANGAHTIAAKARNLDNLFAQTSVGVNVQNQAPATPPSVQITAPSNGSTVSGAIMAAATATDAKSVTGVQFSLDGTTYGAVDTTAPYQANIDTTTLVNGSHTLVATATNASNLSTSHSVSFTVQNVLVPPAPQTVNLITNPSLETATNNAPNAWSADGWGTNTRTFSYEPTGYNSTHSVKATISAYTNGDAKWFASPTSVSGGKTYQYENWYKSSVDTEIDAMVTMQDGSVQYFYVTGALASPTNWQKVTAQFTPPANASTVTMFQVIYKLGYVQTDNYSLSEYTPLAFNRALVSLTFDDGWRSIYTNGLPLLNKYGFVSTQYLNSEPVMGGYPDYMTYQQIKDFSNQGSELAWHTRTHADLTQLSIAQMSTELSIPAAFLSGIGLPASIFKNFATPYGAYNPTVTNEILKTYGSHRSTDVGFNGRDSLNVSNIKVQNITSATTAADVQSWVNQAIANKSWLVIVYHEIGTTGDTTYSATTVNFDQQLAALKQSGVTVKTLQGALDELVPQL